MCLYTRTMGSEVSTKPSRGVLERMYLVAPNHRSEPLHQSTKYI